MASFIVNQSFQLFDSVRREGSTLTLDDAVVLQEIKKGKHPDNGKPLSGLLNHCSPADDATMRLCAGMCEEVKKDEPMTDEEIAARTAEIIKEMEAIGAAVNPGWKLSRLEKELTKAKKEKGA